MGRVRADMRKSLFDYDQVLNTQRDKVYGIRRQALLSSDLSQLMLDFSARTMDDILEVRTRLSFATGRCSTHQLPVLPRSMGQVSSSGSGMAPMAEPGLARAGSHSALCWRCV